MIDMAKREEDERWLTPEDAAGLLKLSIKTVRRKLRSQEIKGYRAGVQWRIKPSDIQAYLEQNTAAYHEQKQAQSE
jgi:excisionase family DNA binding protein